MPIKRPQLANNEIYHIVIRGVEGRLIFEDIADYYRAIHNIFEFNDENPAPEHTSEERFSRRLRKILVEVLAFCLMPNHSHLLLRQLLDKGITKFMRKFGAGYAGYFNKKYSRQGYLFQGRFRAIHIKTEEQLKTVFAYIHTNPASLVDANWKEGNIKSPEAIIREIENYKWSSYQDYLGKNNFPSLTQRNFFISIMPNKEWQKYVNDWIFYKKDRIILNEVALE